MKHMLGRKLRKLERTIRRALKAEKNGKRKPKGEYMTINNPNRPGGLR